MKNKIDSISAPSQRRWVGYAPRLAKQILLSPMVISFLCLLMLHGCAPPTPPVSPNARFTVGPLLFSDDFQSDSHQWRSELAAPGAIAFAHGLLDINVSSGATIWFTKPMHGPLMIQYKATAISKGGPNDRVSDLNCFWMARDPRNPDDLFAVHRSGKFADYNPLLTYYASIGGNGNTTTQFRRYIVQAKSGVLRPQDDRHQLTDLLTANQQQTITLIAADDKIEFYRDGTRLFELADRDPYTSGWFAFRTVRSHLQIQDFRVYSLRVK